MFPWYIDGILMITLQGALDKGGSSLSVHRIGGFVSLVQNGGKSSDGVNSSSVGGLSQTQHHAIGYRYGYRRNT